MIYTNMYSQILPNLIIPLNYFFFQINAKNTTIKLQDQISWKCLSTNEMLKIVLYLRYYNKIQKKYKKNTKMYLTVKKIQNSNQKIVEIKSMPLQTHMTVHSRTSITNNLATCIYGQTFHFRHMYLYSQSDFRYNNLAISGQTFHFRHMYLYSQSDFRYNNLALYGQTFHFRHMYLYSQTEFRLLTDFFCLYTYAF
jgi:hypothetical protein